MNKADRAGELTPLYIAAAETQNLEVVKILANNGAGSNPGNDESLVMKYQLAEIPPPQKKVRWY